MKAIVAVVLLAVVLLVAAKTKLWEGSRYSVEERDKAVLSALSRLNEKSMNVAHLASTGNEFAVGLFMTMNRFKNPLIRKKAIKMAAEVCSRWQKLVAPEPRKQLANVTNPLKVMYWVQMLAMQKKFNTDAKYVDELEAALREKISTLKIKEAFSVAGKNFHEPSTQWTEYGSFCVNLILHNFAHFAGLSDMKVVGKVAMRKMIKKSFRAYRKEYRKLSFKRPANFKLYTKLDGRTQDKFVKDFLPYHDLIYVVTHYVYVFTGYTGNFQKRTSRILRKERRFLAKELPYVVKYVQDPDMIGEMVDSLLALGVKQDNKDIQDGVEFILSHQAKDGMWIDYTHPLLADIQAPELKWFHTTMAAMFSLGDERVKNAKCPLPKVLSVMRSSPRIF